MVKRTLTVISLYPRQMNIYGDRGNLLAIERRAAAHNITVHIKTQNPADPIPRQADIIVGGGGQDSGQQAVTQDLNRIGAWLHERSLENTPMLMICGMYQLFGESFVTNTGQTLPGIGIFHAHTIAKTKRMIGNVQLKSQQFGTIYGYENHSGATTLTNNTKPLGTTLLGCGNNGEDGTEGAVTRNTIGTYLHGSLLPKNPAITDHLLKTAIQARYSETLPDKPHSDATKHARQEAATRPR